MRNPHIMTILHCIAVLLSDIVSVSPSMVTVIVAIVAMAGTLILQETALSASWEGRSNQQPTTAIYPRSENSLARRS